MYIIASLELQQVAFRTNDLDFDPFPDEFGIRLAEGDPGVAKVLKHVPNDPKETPFLKGFHMALHEHMTPGPNTRSLNANMLKIIAGEMNGIQDKFKDSFYLWLRNVFTLATANAIFGSNNPWAKNPTELQKVINASKEAGQCMLIIDITAISDTCPIIVSAYQETTRLTDSHVTTRIVKNGVFLSDSTQPYLLAKGETLHRAPFLKLDANSVSVSKKASTFETEKLRKKAFKPFGGGIHLYPGRHFAFAEILGSVVVLVMGLDISNKRRVPRCQCRDKGERKTVKLVEAVGKAVGRLAAFGPHVQRRKGFEDAVWRFETGLRDGESVCYLGA